MLTPLARRMLDARLAKPLRAVKVGPAGLPQTLRNRLRTHERLAGGTQVLLTMMSKRLPESSPMRSLLMCHSGSSISSNRASECRRSTIAPMDLAASALAAAGGHEAS